MPRYGLPYKGSKNGIAKWVVDQLPSATNLYDLFGGGGAITHRAVEVGRWDNIYYNDINPRVIQLFQDAVAGKYREEKRWISREDFFALKDTDYYVALCWSFGNNCKDYLYSKQIEPYKKALHYARVLGDVSLLRQMGIDGDGSRLWISKHKDEVRKALAQITPPIECVSSTIAQSQGSEALCGVQHLERSQGLQGLQGLEQLESLERSQGLQGLHYCSKSYDEFTFEDNSVIYCDIPYSKTDAPYVKGFDHDKFYAWCEQQTQLTIISEYNMLQDRFTTIAYKPKSILASNKGDIGKVTEKLFVPNHQLQLWNDMKRIKTFF